MVRPKGFGGTGGSNIMSRAETKAELTRWHPPRHDFWLAIAVKKRKHRPSPTGFLWRAEVDLARHWVCGSWPKHHERTAAVACLQEFCNWACVNADCDSIHRAGCVRVEEGLWFAFYRFERPVWL